MNLNWIKKYRLHVGLLVVVILSSALVVEVTAQLFFYIMHKERNVFKESAPNRYKYNKKLGWEWEEGLFKEVHYDFKSTYTVRDGKRFTINKNISEYDINLFGDSFAFGIGVDDPDTIASQLSKLTKKANVNNYGVAGYGPDQVFLKYKAVGADISVQNNNGVNIFIVYSGNDYKDINSTTNEAGVANKPFLKKNKEGYQWLFPEDTKDMSYKDSRAVFKFKSEEFLRYVLKRIPLVVNIRCNFVKPDVTQVNEAIKRFDFLFGSIDKDKNHFVIVPSISIVNDISICDSEGLFVEEIDSYFLENNFSYSNLDKLGVLNKNDFWPNEGHPNQIGNIKIAKAMYELINKSGFH